ncbi:MAG: hypothetical protein IKE91_02575 [Clostridia bacterium]|nr:hypothetical protein [Clostridia bacterium]
MGPDTVGGRMQALKRDFAEALESDFYNEAERKLLKDAIDSVEYIKGFFAGTSTLPRLTEDAETTWGKTWEWLRGAFRKIDNAEQLINQPANELHLEIEGGGNKSASDMSDFGRNSSDKEHSLPGNGPIAGVDLTSGNPLDYPFDFEVPSFKPDPRVREAAEEALRKKGLKLGPTVEEMAGKNTSDEEACDNAEEDGLYSALEYGMGM